MNKLYDLIEEIESAESLDFYKIKELKKKYSKLEETHPKLFKKLMDDPNNSENRFRIKKMLKLYNKVVTGETSTHDASVIVGQELADQYLGHLMKKD